MSAGNPIRPVRFTPTLIDQIEVAINRRNLNAYEAEWSFSDFVRVACKEKLAHMERSRKRRTKKVKVTSEESGVPSSYEG